MRTTIRLLKLPQWYCNTPASIVVGLRSARALCLVRKLKFLGRITALENSNTLSAQTLLSLSDDISSICLVRECRELEQYFGTDFASALLTQDAGPRPCPRDVKEVIEKKDRSLMLTKHAGREDMAIVAKIESEVGWLGPCTGWW